MKYKVVKCKDCGRLFISSASTTIKCPYCRKSHTYKYLKREGYILREFDSWTDAEVFLNKIIFRDYGATPKWITYKRNYRM